MLNLRNLYELCFTDTDDANRPCMPKRHDFSYQFVPPHMGGYGGESAPIAAQICGANWYERWYEVGERTVASKDTSCVDYVHRSAGGRVTPCLPRLTPTPCRASPAPAQFTQV